MPPPSPCGRGWGVWGRSSQGAGCQALGLRPRLHPGTTRQSREPLRGSWVGAAPTPGTQHLFISPPAPFLGAPPGRWQCARAGSWPRGCSDAFFFLLSCRRCLFFCLLPAFMESFFPSGWKAAASSRSDSCACAPGGGTQGCGARLHPSPGCFWGCYLVPLPCKGTFAEFWHGFSYQEGFGVPGCGEVVPWGTAPGAHPWQGAGRGVPLGAFGVVCALCCWIWGRAPQKPAPCSCPGRCQQQLGAGGSQSGAPRM